jgi:hypothetical protein
VTPVAILSGTGRLMRDGFMTGNLVP